MPSISKSPAVILLAVCIGLIASAESALSKPALNDGEAKRAAQVRNARPIHRSPQAATTTALTARANAGEKRPLFGWPVLVTEARKYMGTNPTARKKLWCATFMNMVLAKTGYAGTGSDAAKSFASYGKRVDEPRVGAIAVLTRGKRGGHVGIVTGIDANGNPIIISGNHGKRVGEATYPRNRVIAYVMPSDRVSFTQVASAGPALPRVSDTDHDGGLSSPIDELLAAINAERANDRRPQPIRASEQPVQRAAPEARPVPHRIVQQVATVDVEAPHQRVAAYRVSAIVPNTPLPRERVVPPSAPMPRSRPQIN